MHHARLLFIASLVGLVAIGGGLLVQTTDAPFEGGKTAIWWAFLRLTDPGYLGDDEGLARRVIFNGVDSARICPFYGIVNRNYDAVAQSEDSQF